MNIPTCIQLCHYIRKCSSKSSVLTWRKTEQLTCRFLYLRSVIDVRYVKPEVNESFVSSGDKRVCQVFDDRCQLSHHINDISIPWAVISTAVTSLALQKTQTCSVNTSSPITCTAVLAFFKFPSNLACVKLIDAAID